MISTLWSSKIHKMIKVFIKFMEKFDFKRKMTDTDRKMILNLVTYQSYMNVFFIAPSLMKNSVRQI